jgi:DNA modification methylase
LNDLTAGEFLKARKSWLIADGIGEKGWSDLKSRHPGTFPKLVPAHFIPIYTKKDQVVLDCFAGSGTTLIAAAELKRFGVGIDLNPDYIQLIRSIINKHYFHHNQTTLFPTTNYWNPKLILSDAIRGVGKLEDESVDFVFTSPPYANMLSLESNVGTMTRRKEREKKGLDVDYGGVDGDIGGFCVDNWLSYLEKLAWELWRVVKKDRYVTVVVQNLNIGGKNFRPIAWELGMLLNGDKWKLQDEKIWIQANKNIGIEGWPSRFFTRQCHHYCLTWQKI